MQQYTKEGNIIDRRESFKRSYFTELLEFVFKGLIVLLPTILLIFVASFIFGLIAAVLHPVSSFLAVGINAPSWVLNIISFIIVGMILLAVGLLAKDTWFQNKFSRLEQDYCSQIPFYSSIRDMVENFSGMKSTPFSQVVLVDVYNNGVLMTAFITEKINDDLYTVFVPTAPNPTNGYIFHVPLDKIQFVNTPSDVAMRSVIAMGTGSKYLFPQPQPEEVLLKKRM